MPLPAWPPRTPVPSRCSSLAGQVPRGLIGKNLGAVHEISDQPDVVRPVTKWQRRALRPREIPAAVSETFRQMRSGRPRPVLIEVPPEASVEQEEVTLRDPTSVSRIVPSPEQLREAARVIAQSRLPLIYAGGGVARSDAEGSPSQSGRSNEHTRDYLQRRQGDHSR